MIFLSFCVPMSMFGAKIELRRLDGISKDRQAGTKKRTGQTGWDRQDGTNRT